MRSFEKPNIELVRVVRLYREETGTALSLVLPWSPELDDAKQTVKEVVENGFEPTQLMNVPLSVVDEFLDSLTMQQLEDQDD